MATKTVDVGDDEIREAILETIKRRGMTTWRGHTPVIINWLKNDIFAFYRIRCEDEEIESALLRMLGEDLPPIFIDEEDENGMAELGLTMVIYNREEIIRRTEYIFEKGLRKQIPMTEIRKMFPDAEKVVPIRGETAA